MARPTLEDMWVTIQAFGIEKKILDPKNDLPHEQVSELYETIRDYTMRKSVRVKPAGMRVHRAL